MKISFPSTIKLASGRMLEICNHEDTDYGQSFNIKTKDGKPINADETTEHISILATYARLSGYRVETAVTVSYHIRPMTKLEFATYRQKLNEAIRQTRRLGWWVHAFVISTLICGASILMAAWRNSFGWSHALFCLVNLFFVAPIGVNLMNQYLRERGISKD